MALICVDASTGERATAETEQQFLRMWDDGQPPRAPHPVFGPVPRGFVVLTKINRSFPEGRSVVEEKETMFQAVHLSMIQEQNGGATFWDERYHGTIEVKQSPAEVSRLIAEAQDG